MEGLLFLLVIVIFIITVVVKTIKSQKNDTSFRHKKEHKNISYKYIKKPCIMTRREQDFFLRLDRIFGRKFYIFTQVHLDCLLDHKIQGQNWKAALSVIQKKSVDFVLCDREHLESRVAIELDDSTHDNPVRQKRDKLVEDIFNNSNIALLRLREVGNISDENLVHKIAEAIRNN